MGPGEVINLRGRGGRRAKRGAAAASVAAALVLLAPAAAGAAQWSTARLPGAAGKVFLLGVSCPSRSLCVASGTNNLIATSTDPAGGAGAWDYRYVGDGPWPKTNEWPTEGIAGKQIQAVSCPSASLCVAVTSKGFIYSSSNPTGNSSQWGSVEIHSQGGNTHLYGVSCPTNSLCVAVSGRRGDRGKILSSTDPTGPAIAWQQVELPEAFEFRSISCPTVSLCLATGNDGRIVVSTEPTGPASAWRIVGAPGGPGTVQAISCLPALCASGNEGGNLLVTADPTGPLGAWRAFPGGGSVQITGVSCPSASRCLAVDDNGSVLTSTDPTGGRSAWSYENVLAYAPPPPGGYLEGNALFAASCPTTQLCVAVGSQGQIVAGSDPFAQASTGAGTAAGKGKKKHRRRGPKRPRTKIATVRLPFANQLRHHKGRLLIRFHSVGRAHGFRCSFDKHHKHRFRRCHSPIRLRVRRTGRHVFRVRAIGRTGLKGPVTRKVIRIPPLCGDRHIHRPGTCTGSPGEFAPRR